VVRAFPLAGTVPVLTRWTDFEAYYEELLQLGIIGSMKDFYWDIRPKPEYGTVEIRVCDTPLTIEHAALLGCYAQLLARWLLTERPLEIDDNFYLLYQYNRFEASRYGLDGEIAQQRADRQPGAAKQSIFMSVLDRLRDLHRYAQNEAEILALKRLRHIAYERLNDANWLRQKYKQRGSLNDVMRLASQLWTSSGASHYFH
jgi:carboxylate-amine ligase